MPHTGRLLPLIPLPTSLSSAVQPYRSRASLDLLDGDPAALATRFREISADAWAPRTTIAHLAVPSPLSVSTGEHHGHIQKVAVRITIIQEDHFEFEFQVDLPEQRIR